MNSKCVGSLDWIDGGVNGKEPGCANETGNWKGTRLVNGKEPGWANETVFLVVILAAIIVFFQSPILCIVVLVILLLHLQSFPHGSEIPPLESFNCSGYYPPVSLPPYTDNIKLINYQSYFNYIKNQNNLSLN